MSFSPEILLVSLVTLLIEKIPLSKLTLLIGKLPLSKLQDNYLIQKLNLFVVPQYSPLIQYVTTNVSETNETLSLMSLKAIVSPNALSKRKAANATTTATSLNLSKVFAFRALVLPLTDLSEFFIPTTSKFITHSSHQKIYQIL